VRLADAVREVEGPAEAYDAIRSEDLSTVTVVETGRRARYRSALGAVRIAVARPDRLEIETRSDAATRLVVPRAFFPWRRFSVDGNAVDADPANFCLSSVALPPGIHRVTAVEELPGGSSGAALSLAGALLIGYLGRKKGIDESQNAAA
jgi:hypothetical protein